jgi:hypothetical protein
MTDKTDDKPLYKPFKSSAKNKKFSVFVMKNGKKKLIHFGDTPIRILPHTKTRSADRTI